MDYTRTVATISKFDPNWSNRHHNAPWIAPGGWRAFDDSGDLVGFILKCTDSSGRVTSYFVKAGLSWTGPTRGFSVMLTGSWQSALAAAKTFLRNVEVTS